MLENGRSTAQVQLYPRIIEFLGYYLFEHDINTVRGLIEKCRNVNGWSYYKLGQKLGVDGTTIIYWKNHNYIFKKDAFSILLELLKQNTPD
jgi:hypothetical protein